MMNQATGSDAVAVRVRWMVNEPVPGTAAASVTPDCTFRRVASTRLDGVTPPWLTVTDALPAATVAVPDVEKVTLPVTTRAVPVAEAAKTPVPWVEVPLTPVPPPELASVPSTPAWPLPPVVPCTPVPWVEAPKTPAPPRLVLSSRPPTPTAPVPLAVP